LRLFFPFLKKEKALDPIISPASLCGKYYFVWEDEQLGQEFRPEAKDRGVLTITCAGEPTLDNISGSVSFFKIRGLFKGLSPKHVYDGDEEIPNCWAFRKSKLHGGHQRYKSSDFADADDDADQDTHWISPLKVLDDRGQPFVEFVYEEGWSGCCPQYLVWIGKKQVDGGQPEGLSADEKMRLGMGMEVEELEKIMKQESESKDLLPTSEPTSESSGTNKRKADEDDDREEKLPLKAPKLEDV
jgi:hypothetical protein